MTIPEYFSLIKNRFIKYFDVAENGKWLSENYELVAKFEQRETQTALFKDNVMDYLETKEICLVSSANNVTFIKDELSKLPSIAIKSANAGSHHKETLIVRVFVMEKTDDKSVYAVRNFKFSKAFKFFLWGYCKCATILIDLASNKFWSNKIGRMHSKMFSP